MTNLQVTQAWAAGKDGHSLNLHSIAGKLYSYGLCIGMWRDGLPVVFNYTAHDDGNPFGHKVSSGGFQSKTTSCHVGLARRVGYCFQKED
ncbi:hypothetical protein LCGC14_2049850 [marine sediment metagenome]|uniref:Uncharacterized protein n=1 Tax=marine sediment metagenome TaxID=412755 RepID=A0A0F9H2T2_9ZZZZ